MTLSRRMVPGLVTVAAIVSALPMDRPARAQVPDRFSNLQVLPKDISREDLVREMRGFASSLGVRCVYCHKGEDNPGLEDVDFASDARETKKTARLMMRMVYAINTDHIGRVDHPGRPSATQVSCFTCHHGLRRPQTLERVIGAALEESGPEGATAKYRELRAKYHGQAAYDFGQGPLNTLGEARLDAKDYEAAAVLLAMNLEFNPDAGWTHYLMGEAWLGLGQRDKARAEYERAAALEPRNPMARNRLEELSAPTASPRP
jgi:tetratricopeptide (TPR) repeat protein